MTTRRAIKFPPPYQHPPHLVSIFTHGPNDAVRVKIIMTPEQMAAHYRKYPVA